MIEVSSAAVAAGWTEEEVAFAIVNLALAAFQRSEAARSVEFSLGLPQGELCTGSMRVGHRRNSAV